MNISKNY